MNRWFKFIAISLLVALAVAFACHHLVTAYAIHEAHEHISDILLSNRGFHQYIQRVMHPAFFNAMDAGHIEKNYYNPQLLSSTYIIRNQHKIFNEIRESEGMSPVYYKLAAINPRNPVNKADEKEAELIRLFNADRQLRESEEIVYVDGHKFVYYAIPFLVNQERCLRCHGNPDDAPPGLRAMYPDDGGFHEKVGEIRAVESIRMPVDAHIHSSHILTIAASSGIFMLLMLGFVSASLSKSVQDKTVDLVAEIDIRRKTEESYREVVEGTGDLIIKVDAMGNINYVNPIGEKILGGNLSKLIGKSAFDFIHPEDKEETRAQLEECAKNKEGRRSFENRQVNQKTGEVSHMLWTANSHYDEDGNLTQITAIARNITERIKAEEELRESRETFKVLVESTEAVHWEFDVNNNLFTYVSPQAEVVTGYPADEWTDLDSWANMVHPDDREWALKFCMNEVKHNRDHDFTYRIRTRQGQVRWLRDIAKVLSVKNRSLKLIGVMLDVTKIMESEQKLIEFQNTLDNTHDCVFIFSPGSLKFRYANQGAIDQIGYSEDELMNMTPADIKPEFTFESFNALIQPLLSGERGALSFETIHRHKNGTDIPVEIVLQFINASGKAGSFIAIARNISERRKADETIRKSLREKEILLKEVHHRVKNNMAVISSLLSLQSGYIEDEKYIKMFKESQSRIRSMALVHEQLYKSDDFSSIDVNQYINTLAKNIKTTFGLGKQSEVRTDILSVNISIDELIPLGLIINELLTNSYKHGFDGKDRLTIDISLKRHSDSMLMLRISDDGKGFADGFEIESSGTGLGLKLVKTLTKQIDGELTVEKHPATFTIIFPEKIEHARYMPNG